MTRTKILALTLALFSIALWKAPARAGDFGDLMDTVHIGYWRNTCWPKPFIYPDRKAAMAPMIVMANNGWRRNNLLGAHHFHPDGHQLNTAGELRVRWVLTQAPPHRRQLFVERSIDPEETGRRIETVHQFATRVVPEGNLQVADTHIRAEGKPAVDVNWTNVQFRQNAPIPELPSDTNQISVVGGN